ncbi:MAG: DinB family protein [Acidobacteriota bacterium]
MLKVVMHSRHHRGQNMARLRALGGEPPTCDYIAWTWLDRPAPRWS